MIGRAAAAATWINSVPRSSIDGLSTICWDADASAGAWIAHAVRLAADELRLGRGPMCARAYSVRRRRSGTSNGGREEHATAAAAAWTYGSYDEHVAPRRLFATAAAGSTRQMP
ncbi:hypothetical protein ACP70R_008027 [Stipagrostis hirtigluma subsp. patula]